MTTTISEFNGPYAFLSNFYQSPVDMDPPFPALVPFRYATAEHAYQAAKTTTASPPPTRLATPRKRGGA